MPVTNPLRILHLMSWCLVLLLTGCQSSGMGNALQTLQAAVWGPVPPPSSGLDPRFSYLRVTVGKKVAFLALGYVDPHPQGPVEVWYSAEREVIRLQNGYLVGAAGTLTEWRQVRLSARPAWRELAKQNTPYTWTRTRDVMPGYQYNVIDSLQVVTIAAPERSQLVGIAPTALTWFEESLISTKSNISLAKNLRPSRYAVEFVGTSERVVYAEQCLSVDLCMTWQRWRAGQ